MPSRPSAVPTALLLALLLLAACGGVTVSQDYDPAALSRFPKYRTFDWFPGGHEVHGEGEIDDPFLDQRVRAAVAANLTSRGYQKVENRTPDFYVNHHLSVRQRMSSSGINTYYGVGSYGSWGGVSVGMGTSPVRTYDEGTLVIDVIDATSRQLVWRGTGTKALHGSATPADSSRDIHEAVNEILKQFPPGAPAT
jgi:hypothetical protein